MADDEQLRANLELPKLFGRKKKDAEPEEPIAESSDTEAEVAEPDEPTAESSDTEPEVAEPEAEPGSTPDSEPVSAAPEPDATAEAGSPQPSEPEQLTDAPAAVSERPEPEAPEAEAAPETPGTEPDSGDEAEPGPISSPATERPSPRPEAAPAAEEPRSVATDQDDADETATATIEEEPAEKKRAGILSGAASRMRSSAGALPVPGLPVLEGYRAAAVTGAVIGLLLVGFTAGTMKACGLVRGADTCGRSGVFLLAAIFVLMVIGSTALLRVWGVREPGSTALLAVGIVSVVALLLLIDILFSAWMALVIPVVSAGAFMLSFWITDNYADELPRD